ncbi:MAG: hypothetical protein ACRC46_11590 [Thermoguttaceae bacterium]
MKNSLQKIFRALLCLATLLVPRAVLAYTYNKATEPPLTVEIEKIAPLVEVDAPQVVTIKLRNSSDSAINAKLTLRTIEAVEFVGTDDAHCVQRTTNVPANGEAVETVSIAGRAGVYAAHYPISCEAVFTSTSGEKKLLAVQPVESQIRSATFARNETSSVGKLVENVKDLPLITLPAHGIVALATTENYRGVWTRDSEPNQPPHFLPVGFTGTDVESSANIWRGGANRGSDKQTIHMHPTYKGGAGNVAVEYRVALPDEKPITLIFDAAIRDVRAPEPPSDGVTFRVVAVDPDTGREKIVAERHTKSTSWERVTADLSPFAGREIALRLVSDPGPKRDTTCDACFWGNPLLVAGEVSPMLDPQQFAADRKAWRDVCAAVMQADDAAAAASSLLAGHAYFVFPLDSDLKTRGVIALGAGGFATAAIAVGTREKFVVYSGLEVDLQHTPLGELACEPLVRDKSAPFAWTQKVNRNGKSATMKYALGVKEGALQISVDCSEPNWITRVAFGPTDQSFSRVYFGHGYCVVDPVAFSHGAGGHGLSTSHVATDYENGLSVLMATTTPPINFTVNSANKLSTLIVSPGTTMTLLPSPRGAFDAAIRYRAVNHLKAGPGLATKNGRLCFDIWGGSYKNHIEILENAVRYGITDSMFVSHNWQRYGYDNRLPDIFPPNPDLGTLEEMQQALKIADAAGILYGVHDNYIDFYPDAADYSFDNISFEENGQPRRAWFNPGIDALSYQFRPDRIAPFLKRNLDLITPALPMSCYFVDVFASAPPCDFFDRDGNFHSRAETLQHWNAAFDTIRETFSAARKDGVVAPTISESGDDFLAGHLDGADCQFMFLSTEPGEFRSWIPCREWSRVPWFDIVNHTTFSLHGAGYSSRYEASRGRSLHGIESDDYLMSEILTGHALMVDHGSAIRGAVRKQWLLQPTVRELAGCEIDSVTFDGDNIHRLVIVWKSPDGKRETTVHINGGLDDWDTGYLTLPRYGFVAAGPAGIAGVARDQESGHIIELASYRNDSETSMYVNARQQVVDGLQPIRPTLESFKYLGDNRFECSVAWDAAAPASRDDAIFLHCVEPRVSWDQKIKEAFFGGGHKPIPATEWSGKVVTPMDVVAIPDTFTAGKYHVVVGMYDAKGNGQRATLLGHDVDNRRYSLGLLVVERDASGKVTRLSIEPTPDNDPAEQELQSRLLPPKEAIEFGKFKTKGAFLFRSNAQKKRITVTPLPNEPATEVAINRRGLGDRLRITAIDANEKTVREVTSTESGEWITFTTAPGEFGYVIEAK